MDQERLDLAHRLGITAVAAAILWLIGGLTITRLLYEGLFPRLLWLARPLPVLIIALLFALLGWWLWRRRLTQITPFVLLPLLLNLIPLMDTAVNPIRSWFLFGASLWLSSVFIAWQIAAPKAWRWLGPLFVLIALLPTYLLTMPLTVGRADTFEFQVVAPQLGIAHPTGYPLYLLLGKLWTLLLPVGAVAWRLNVGTAVYALLAVIIIFFSGWRLLQRPIPALLSAVVLGLIPTFWSQAIEAEVYTLHALIVAFALWLMIGINDGRWTTHWSKAILALAFVIGLGLTNHLTTVFLLPPAILIVLLTYHKQIRSQSAITTLKLLLKVAAVFLLPLLLYAYLPIRWAAVNNEPMGVARFIDWVVAGRFRGALQLTAWLNDMTRYAVISRLFLENWSVFNLGLVLLGLVTLFWRNWHIAVALLLTWFGYTFYSLNYYVPDLAVFLIAAHVVMALWWAAGVTALLAAAAWVLEHLDKPTWQMPLTLLLLLLIIIPTLTTAVTQWPQIDRSADDGQTTWGKGVLSLPLAPDSAILADSEKIAPLYYLQQAEGLRPDLEIMVLPDEAAYRAELDARLAAGQAVYLARFLPGLEGIYHLRSFGPLLEVSTQPLTNLPQTAVSTQLDFGPIQLVGYDLSESAAVDPQAMAVTLYWQATQTPENNLNVYVRLTNDDVYERPINPAGQNPADNYYPMTAWKADEIVSDYHLLPHPINAVPQTWAVQVALAPSFSPPDTLAWQTVTEVTLPATNKLDLLRPLRTQNGRVLLDGVSFSPQIRPQTPLPLLLSGYGDPDLLQLSLQLPGAEQPDALSQAAGVENPLTVAREVSTDVGNGRYELIATDPAGGAICGWLLRPSASCVLGEIEVSGVSLPQDAVNFADKIALLEIEIGEEPLQPGMQLSVNLIWQSLTPIDEDYTLFIQVLDTNDQILGQIDAWPLQGTYPTSQWSVGEKVTDPYLVQITNDLPPGPYRLQVGWYLLADLRRLSVLSEDGNPLDDKVVVPIN